MKSHRRARLSIMVGLVAAAIVGAWASLASGALVGSALRSDPPSRAAAPAAVPPAFTQEAPASLELQVAEAGQGMNNELSFPPVDRVNPGVADSADKLKADWTGVLAVPAADSERFRFAGGVGYRTTDGRGFIFESTYTGPGRQQLAMMSWTPTGPVELFILSSSPTHKAEERTIDGRQVLLITPTENVVERRGLYRAYIVGLRAVHVVDAVDFSSADDFVGLVERMVTQGEVK